MTTTSAYEPGGRPRRLERSRDDRWIAGVCGGLGSYLGIDPVIVRLVAVALTFAGGAGVIAYIAAILLVPDQGAAGPILRTGLTRRGDRPWVIAGAVLLGLGALGLLDTLDFGWGGGVVWSLLIFGAGAYLLLRHTDLGRSLGIDVGRAGSTHESPTRQAGEPTGESPAPHAGGPADASSALQAGGPADETPAPHAGGPADASPTLHAGDPLDPGTRPTEPLGAAEVTSAPPRRRRPRRATGIALGAVLLVVGLAGALLAAGAYDLRTETFVAGAVIVTGLALVASAWLGGAPPLIWLGLATAAVLGMMSAVGLSLSGGAGDRVYEPSGAAALRSEYKLGAGRLWVDLRNTKLPAGTTTLEADLGMGELTVVVPEDAQVQVKGSAGAGEVQILGRETSGADVERTVTDTPRRLPGAGSVPRLVLDTRVALGELRVFRGQDSPRPDSDFDRAGARAVPVISGGA